MNKRFTDEEWNICLKVLEALKDNPIDNPDNVRFKSLITKIHKKAKKVIADINYVDDIPNIKTKEKSEFISKKNQNLNHRKNDIEILLQTQVAQAAINNKTNYSETTEYEVGTNNVMLKKAITCYCCGNKFNEVHFFYNRLCPKCAEYNYSMRTNNTDLNNRNVIITGGRVKIGYATTLRLLRAGANIIVTSRFPALTLDQLKQEQDYKNWKNRVTVYGLDLRNIYAVDEFVKFVKQHFSSLDIIINNAAQTIKYTSEHYTPLVAKELLKLDIYQNNELLIANKTPINSDLKLVDAKVNQTIEYKANRFGQPIDYRTKNSWNSTLDEIDTYELLEVNLINHISPYILIRELKPLLLKSSFKDQFIINVTSTEGQFSYINKTIFHPHTNMTKAALNMLTKTSSDDFAKDNIYMNSVDVGWVSTGAIEPLRERQFEQGYIPPLDPVDGAARIFHPIDECLKGNIISGKLLKDYKVVDW